MEPEPGDVVEDGIRREKRGAAALVRLRDHARYATSIEALVAHLPERPYSADNEALTLCWTMVEAMAFRASGLRGELTEGTGKERSGSSVRFTLRHGPSFMARRRW